MLLENKSDINAVDALGRTPLHAAAERGQVDIARMLGAHGASLTALDKAGRTPDKVTDNPDMKAMLAKLAAAEKDKSAMEKLAAESSLREAADAEERRAAEAEEKRAAEEAAAVAKAEAEERMAKEAEQRKKRAAEREAAAAAEAASSATAAAAASAAAAISTAHATGSPRVGLDKGSPKSSSPGAGGGRGLGIGEQGPAHAVPTSSGPNLKNVTSSGVHNPAAGAAGLFSPSAGDDYNSEDDEPLPGDRAASQIPRQETLEALAEEGKKAAKARADAWRTSREAQHAAAEAKAGARKAEELRLAKAASETAARVRDEAAQYKEKEKAAKAAAIASMMAKLCDPALTVPEAQPGDFSLDQLRQAAGKEAMRDKGIVSTKREWYLSPKDFEAAFGMSKEDFYHLPEWKQAKTKKEQQLF